MNLDKRLLSILSEIKTERIADIGTDHGKVAVELALLGKKRVLATDISALSLQKAKNLATEECVFDRIDFRVGDGLSVVEDGEVDEVVITGMGGMEIIKIIEGRDIGRYILSPQKDAPKVREFLLLSRRSIEKDYTVESGGKFYDIIVSEKERSLESGENEKRSEKCGCDGKIWEDETLDEHQLLFGKDYAESPDFKKRAEFEISRLQKNIGRLEKDNEKGKKSLEIEMELWRTALEKNIETEKRK